MGGRLASRITKPALLALLVLAMLPFVLHAWGSGGAGLRGTPVQLRLFDAQAPFANWMIFGHMMFGAAITFLVPFQLWHWPRQAMPRAHRWNGYLLFIGSLATGCFGFAYILLRGTIGGPLMNAGFGLYGVLLILAACATVAHARARRFEAHRRWALRLFVLAIGSWIYRVHYHLWYIATGGIASTPEFTGAFDLAQNVAFYLPYLLALELWFARERAQKSRSTQTSR